MLQMNILEIDIVTENNEILTKLSHDEMKLMNVKISNYVKCKIKTTPLTFLMVIYTTRER